LSYFIFAILKISFRLLFFILLMIDFTLVLFTQNLFYIITDFSSMITLLFSSINTKILIRFYRILIMIICLYEYYMISMTDISFNMLLQSSYVNLELSLKVILFTDSQQQLVLLINRMLVYIIIIWLDIFLSFWPAFTQAFYPMSVLIIQHLLGKKVGVRHTECVICYDDLSSLEVVSLHR